MTSRRSLPVPEGLDGLRLDAAISRLTKEMKEAAKNLDFELAAELRDKLKELEAVLDTP